MNPIYIARRASSDDPLVVAVDMNSGTNADFPLEPGDAVYFGPRPIICEGELARVYDPMARIGNAFKHWFDPK
jgi:hypothetical protein